MPNTPPKIKSHPAIPPELKRTLVQPAQVDSVAATVPALVTDFNALLAKLRAAGILDS